MSPDPTILSELRKNAQILNESSDELTHLIKDFETELSSLNIGVAYWNDLPIFSDHIIEAEGEQNAEQIIWNLGYCKIGDAWRIAAQQRCLRLRKEEDPVYDSKWHGDGFVFVDDPIPLEDAPRIIRVEAASRLDQLMVGLNEKLTKYIKSIQDATGAF